MNDICLVVPVLHFFALVLTHSSIRVENAFVPIDNHSALNQQNAMLNAIAKENKKAPKAHPFDPPFPQ